MTSTLTALLDEIQADKALYDRNPESPASAEELQTLQQEAAQQLGYKLPAAYLDILTRSNGVDWNGFELYGTGELTAKTTEGQTFYERQGLVEANLVWRDYPPNNDYVFLAQSGDELYCHHLTNDKFEIVDRITKEPIYEPSTFDTCEELLEKLLNHMLNRYDDAEA